jgi:hypothetical protein
MFCRGLLVNRRTATFQPHGPELNMKNAVDSDFISLLLRVSQTKGNA